MIFPELRQLILITSERKREKVIEFVNDKNFIFFLLGHLKSYFDDLGISFIINEPLIDPSIEVEQQTSLFLNDFAIGDFSLLYNSVFDEVTLVYSSASGLLKTKIIDSDSFDELTLNDYLILLHEFCAVLRSEYNLYLDFKK